MPSKKPFYAVSATYPANPDTSDKLRELAGRGPNGSGVVLATGIADASWYFEQAQEAGARFLAAQFKAAGIPNLDVEVHHYGVSSAGQYQAS